MLPALIGSRCLLGLNSDDLDPRVHRLGDDAGAGGPGPAAYRDDDDIGGRLLLQHLERMRTDARDQQRFVARIDIAVTVLFGEPGGIQASIVKPFALQDHFGPKVLHRLDLDRVRVFRRADDRAHPEKARGVGNRLTMVPRRGGDDAAFALIVGEPADEVDASPHFEGSGRVVVLVLDVDIGTENPGQRRVTSQWGHRARGFRPVDQAAQPNRGNGSVGTPPISN